MAKYTFNELDQKILAGFKQFQETHSGLFCGVHEAYTQGFLDGIRCNLDDLAKAYRKDQLKDQLTDNSQIKQNTI